MTQRLIILGTGGNAYDLLDLVEAINAQSPAWQVAGYLDDARPVGSEHAGLKVLGRLADAHGFPEHLFVNAIGSDKSFTRRKAIIASTGLAPDAFATLVHPRAAVSCRATLGRGVYVGHGCSVGGAAVLGDHVALSPGATVGHDAVVGAYSILSPLACVSGSVRVGESCYLGARAVVRQQLTIGDGSLVGMGAVVVKDVEAGSVVAGNPARPLARRGAAARPANAGLPSVDVIVPCYRYAHYLRACVASVLEQPGVEVRVLVIDDCSPDDTEAVGRKLAAEDGRVEYRRHAVNCGHIATYNEGIDWAAGKYMLLLSADDLLTAGALRRATTLLEEHPEAGMVNGRDVRGATPVGLPADVIAFKSTVTSGVRFLEDVCATSENVVSTPTAVVRTSLQKRLGGYRPQLTHSGDFEMWMRFAAHGAVGFVDAPQAFYRQHGENMNTQYPGVHDLRQRKAAFDALFTTYGHNLDPGLKATAYRALAVSAFWSGSKLFDEGKAAECAEHLAWAASVDPSVRRSPAWAKFQIKRLLGPAGWSAVRPVVRRLRGDGRGAVSTV